MPSYPRQISIPARRKRQTVVRQLAIFLSRIGGRIGLPFGRSLVEEDLGAHWVALNIYVMLGHVDPAATIPVGDSKGRGFAGFTTVETVLKTVQDGWGHWDRSTQARWCRTLAEVTPYLLRDKAKTSREVLSPKPHPVRVGMDPPRRVTTAGRSRKSRSRRPRSS
jgi:hypothetical protein